MKVEDRLKELKSTTKLPDDLTNSDIYKFRSYTNKSDWSYVKVDPYPCYTHDKELVLEHIKHVEDCFPLPIPPKYYILHKESLGRENGAAGNLWALSKEGLWIPESYIYFCGKRLPIHPIITRYLVAHEYGHAVGYWIEHKEGDDPTHLITAWHRRYAKLRGIEAQRSGEPKQWHKNVIELIANDFRICVCGVDEEYWPHKGIKHPNELPQIQSLWEELKEKYAVK